MLELQKNLADIVVIPAHPHQGSVPSSVPLSLVHPLSEVGTQGHLPNPTTLPWQSDLVPDA